LYLVLQGRAVQNLSRAGGMRAQVIVTATDAAGYSAACSFKVTVLGPRRIKLKLLGGPEDLRTAVTEKQDADKLDQAIDNLRRSLDASLWIGEANRGAAAGFSRRRRMP
jgi:hypothetical protein